MYVRSEIFATVKMHNVFHRLWHCVAVTKHRNPEDHSVKNIWLPSAAVVQDLTSW